MNIHLNNAGKKFNREWIFRKINYSFSSGNSYAVIGANGSGKSTLLQAISGSLMLNEGEIKFILNDEEIKDDKVHKHISFAAPYLELIEEMTAEEFLLFHAKFKKLLNNFSIEETLAAVELQTAQNKQIRFFSSGMKQRLKLAQAIFSDVPVVLLDEPCTNLDAAGIELYYNLIKNFTTTRIVIVCSNDVKEYNFCKEILNIQEYKQLQTSTNIS